MWSSGTRDTRWRSNTAYDLLKDIKGIVVNRTNGAFYMTVMFEEGALNGKQSLPVKDKAVKELVEKITNGVALDKRFVYYLLATTGICVVPLTGFNCNLKGFRITLLETTRPSSIRSSRPSGTRSSNILAKP